MADITQLKILKRGVEEWNKWMGTAYEEQIEVDLSGANLSGMHLSRAFLWHVNLKAANLSRANLYEVNLEGADLTGAILKGADLSHASLNAAILRNADLSPLKKNRTNLWKAVCNRTVFCGANLSKANLYEAVLSQGADLSGKDTILVEADMNDTYLAGSTFKDANLQKANLQNVRAGNEFGPVDFSGTNLEEADMYQGNFTGAFFVNANLRKAFLAESNLSKANFTKADLTEAHLEGANLVESILEESILNRSHVYGISVWKSHTANAQQSDLVITPEGEAAITVSDLQVAQFIYLLLNNQNVRNVIDTITSKAVLILGRFTDERKAILEALHAELRKRNYLPILFDFSGPLSRDITETVSTLAHLARFVIADITDAKSIPQELQAIVPDLPSVPVQPILLASQEEYGMFGHFKRYPWVLPTYYYKDIQEVVASLQEKILSPLESKVVELAANR